MFKELVFEVLKVLKSAQLTLKSPLTKSAQCPKVPSTFQKVLVAQHFSKVLSIFQKVLSTFESKKYCTHFVLKFLKKI